MKKNLSKVCALLLLIGSFSACVQEETIDQPNQTQDVSFSFNIGDRGTKIEGDIPEYEGENGCKDLDDLKALATAGKLEANITISKDGLPLEPIKLAIKNLTNGNLQTLAYPFAMGTYKIQAVTITSTQAGDTNPLFSGVKTGSKYAAYIPTNQHMEEAGFTIGESNKFKKTPIDLWVLCASKITPEEFGFIKWNINYVKAHCFAFMVNVCNPGDNSGAGELLIEYKVKGEKNFTLLHQIAFNSDGDYDEFCFKDDYGVPDSLELYQLTLTIDGEKQTKNVTLEVLKDYTNSPSWDNEKNFMHLNFCTCQTWIFDCDTENVPVPTSKCLNKIRIVEGNSGTNGSDSYIEVANETGTKANPANPLFTPANYGGWGDINDFEEQSVPNGDFTLPNGKSFRSINSVHFQEGQNKVMEVTLHLKTTSNQVAGQTKDLCDLLFFSADNTFIGYYRISGKVDESKPIILKEDCDKLTITSPSGQKIKLPTGADKCYKIGIRTYSDAQWALNIKQFWLQL